MATPSKLQAMRSRFSGRITDTHPAHAEFTARPPVLVPATAADVGRALTLAREAGRTAYVRSGGRVTSADKVTDKEVAVVSLEVFDSIEIDLERVRVGAAATVGDLATELRNRALFLPLPDQPTVSLVATVLGDHRPSFPKSVGAQPAMWEGVVEAVIVPFDRAHLAETRTLDAAGWAAFRGQPDGVVTSLVLDASRWRAHGGNRWFRGWMIPYDRQTFEAICDQLLAPSAALDHVDLSLRASKSAEGSTLVVIRATGQGRERSEQVRNQVESVLESAKTTVLWSHLAEGAGSSIAAWVGAGPGRAGRDEVHDERLRDDPWKAGNEGQYLNEVDRQIKEGAWVDLRRGSLLRRALLPASAAAALLPPAAVGVVPLAAAVVAGPQAVAGNVDVLGLPVPKAHSSAPPTPTGSPNVEAIALAPTHKGGPIPDFQGEVFQRSVNDSAYRKAIDQYAVSSLDAATVAARMRPLLVAVAKNDADVVRAVAWAVRQGHKVVARSGGHQYCGLSSGGADTVLVDVKLLESVSYSPATRRITVGPGLSLAQLNRELMTRKVSIPHGECPLVNIGGHVQTGGVGHQLRSLGLALDWVREFDMVVWDANDGAVQRTYRHSDPLPNEVFAAVLGGGPGSWGVLTSITFEVVSDGDHPDSFGLTRVYPYNRAGWAAAFDQMRLWSEREHLDTLPAEIDLFLTVLSGNTELLPHANLRPPVLMLETTALAKAGRQEVQAVVDAVADQVSWINRLVGGALNLLGRSAKGELPLSAVVAKGVRGTGALGGMPGGREFDLPYRKSLYVTRSPLPVGFCERFVDLVDRAYRTDDIKVVFQGVVGGGRFQANRLAPTTRMQQRDALVQIVFDVFYTPGHAKVAESFQAEMLRLWQAYLPEESGRMFWGTYEDSGTNGAQLDMSRPATQAMYYDTPTAYTDLQKVKTVVDPKNVFQTSFTVR